MHAPPGRKRRNIKRKIKADESENQPQKKKRTCLSNEVKVKAVKDFAGGITATKIAEKLGVHVSALYTWKKKVSKLEESPPTQRKSRPSLFPVLDQELLKHFKRSSNAGDIISDQWLLLKAEEVYTKADPQVVSSVETEQVKVPFGRGFIRRWKQRHCVRSYYGHGEKADADVQAAGKFPQLSPRKS